MTRYSAFSLLRQTLRGHRGWDRAWRDPEPKRHYDVIICDLKMPKLDGMAFFREVSAKMPHVARRLIFVTGDVAGTEAGRFLEETGCRWIAKPFRLRDLVRTAREALG